MKMKNLQTFKPNIKVTKALNNQYVSTKREYILDFINTHFRPAIDDCFEFGYKNLAHLIIKHFKNMNLEFVNAGSPEEKAEFIDTFSISRSPYSWSHRSPYNHILPCEFDVRYVDKLILFYKEFKKKTKKLRKLKFNLLNDIDPDSTPLIITYEIFPLGKTKFIPRISLFLETSFLKIWIYTEGHKNTSTIEITFKTISINFKGNKKFKETYLKNINRTIYKHFDVPKELVETAQITFHKCNVEIEEGRFTLYYSIPNKQLWHLSIDNILGLIDLLLKGL